MIEDSINIVREIDMNKRIRPLMLGDCSCCIHKGICRYKGVAGYIKDKFKECTISHNPFKLICESFECDKLR